MILEKGIKWFLVLIYESDGMEKNQNSLHLQFLKWHRLQQPIDIKIYSNNLATKSNQR